MSSVRRATWVVGAPFRAVALAAIRVYRATLSGWLGGQCRFVPSCSLYAEDAIRARGVVIGSALAAWRILRCNPFGAGGIDPAPQPRRNADRPRSYDAILRSSEAVDA